MSTPPDNSDSNGAAPSDDRPTVTRTIHPEIRVIDATQGLVDYIASDETIDSYDEIIKADGWRFDRFQKNAPFLNSHSMYDIRDLLGKVESWTVKNGKLTERVRWAIDVAENAIARLGFAMTAGGYLKAVSVGFIPEQYHRRNDGDPFTQALDSVPDLDNDSRDRVRLIYTQQQQIELSSCCIGANPSAVTAAYKDHAISEEMLHDIGIGDDEFDILADMARIHADPDQSHHARSLAELASQAAFQQGRHRRKLSDQHRTHSDNTPAPTASPRDRAAGSTPDLSPEFLADVLTELKDIA